MPPTRSQREALSNPNPNTGSPEASPGVFVVRDRPGGFSAKLLPPLLLVMLGASFLIYRSVASDWRGVYALFSARPNIAATPPKPDPAPLLALNDAPPPTLPAPEAKPPEPATPPTDTAVARKEETPKPKAEEPINPLEDIEREAAKTKERIAELERLKEKEKEKQESTSQQRRNMPNKGDHDKMIAAQRRLLQRQMAWMAEAQRQQMRDMAEMQRRFLSRNFDAMPMPMPPGWGMDFNRRGNMLPPNPRFGNVPRPPHPGLGDKDVPDGDEVVKKTPDGTTRFRRFQGADGSNGFIFEFRGNDAPPEDLPQP